MIKRSELVLSLVVFCFCLMIYLQNAPASVAAATLPKRESKSLANFSATGELTLTLFLPIVSTTPGKGISGYVLQDGQPVVGRNVRLLLDPTIDTIAQTTTDTSGKYLFTRIPSIASPKHYFVRYSADDNPNVAGDLYSWQTSFISNYISDTEVSVKTFDVSDVSLVSPNDGATVQLPVTLRWAKRSAYPSDSYRITFFSCTTCPFAAYSTPFLGFVDNYTLNTNVLPANILTGEFVRWEISFLTLDQEFGSAGFGRAFKISNS